MQGSWYTPGEIAPNKSLHLTAIPLRFATRLNPTGRLRYRGLDNCHVIDYI